MRHIKLLISLFITLFFYENIGATEIVGGSLRYESLGNQKYKIIGTINRNCGGTPLSLPIFSIYSKNASDSLKATRTSIKDITHYCKTDTPVCKPSNVKNTDGQEQHTFETIVDFSVYPYNTFYDKNECEVFFSMEACCRSSSTTNITANKFYLEAMLNLCALGTILENSNSKTTPDSYLEMCCNLPFIYSFFNADPDSDSLLFEIVSPKKSKDSFERFNGQFTTQYPMTSFCLPPGTLNCKPLPSAKPPRGFFFDKASGDMIITPIYCDERAILNIRTSEYRLINGAMTLIGYSTNEVFATVKKCPDNNPPTIPTSNKWSVCEGDKLCFTIQSKDTRSTSQTTDDTTYLSWNKAIPAATFIIVDPTAREKSAQFCWQTKVGDSRLYAYQFTVNATDSNCNMPGGISKGFLITVKPKAKAIRQYKKLAGNQLVFEGKTPDSLKYNYEWQIGDSVMNLPLYKSYKRIDSFKFTDTGKYFITMIVNNPAYNCPTTYVDTIYIDGSVTASLMSITLSAIRIYPNPTDGLINIDMHPDIHWSEMKLFNSTGQLLFTGPAEMVFDMGSYPSGHYILEFTGNGVKHKATLIKE